MAWFAFLLFAHIILVIGSCVRSSAVLRGWLVVGGLNILLYIVIWVLYALGQAGVLGEWWRLFTDTSLEQALEGR